MKVLLARPRGFCAGVNRAITIVHQALERYGPPVFVLHEIVHNTHVLDELRRSGAVFVEELEEIPPGSVTIFSAHGVSRSVNERAKSLGLRTIDATCPLVSKVHQRMRHLHRQGYEVLVIGHKGHPEVEGTCGQAEGLVHVISRPSEVAALEISDPRRIGYVTQTTLSVHDTAEILDAIQQRFPGIEAPNRSDICYATTNRQAAVRRLAECVDVVLIVGSKNSSNSNRLREGAEKQKVTAHLINDASEIDKRWFTNARSVGVSAGASAPEHLVIEVVEWLRHHGATKIKEMDGAEERIRFSIPDLES